MRAFRTVTITRIGSHQTVCMAADELKRYLNALDPEALVDVRIYDAYDANLPKLLWVGLDEQLDKKVLPVENKAYDDAICIDVRDFSGIITGANERAVLIAAYRFLKELGIRWLCPGKFGEVIPARNLDACEVHISEVPSFRHRTMCIEGANSYEHVCDMIDWMPKMGMNSYYFQLFIPSIFFSRWYSHERNERLGKEPFTYEDACKTHQKLLEDTKRRSMMVQAGGHGWTSKILGYNPGDWDYLDESTLLAEDLEMLAMIDGKRGLRGNSPTNTQLCYSNPRVISFIVKEVADYCEAHPEADIFHMTLADQRNNFCECEKCRPFRPADIYVKVLNAIDEEMTARNIPAKIVISAYNDTSWAPLTESFRNPHRFLLLFAPITRRFTDSYADVDLDNLPEEEWPFELNKLVMPRQNTPIVKVMKGWDDFKVYDRLINDYHYWSTTFISDIGGFKIADTMSRDIKTFKSLDLNGYISCQVQRYSFPTGVPMQVMADTLWNENASFDEIAEDHLRTAFGKHYQDVRTYLETLSNLAAYWVKNEEPDVMVDEKRKTDNEKGLEVIAQYRPLFTKLYEAGKFENNTQRYFWRFLMKHLELSELVLKLQVRKFSGESPKERLDAIDALANAYRASELELHRVLDVWRQLLTLAFATPIEDAH